MQLVDSHCHLNFPDFEGRIPDILQNAVFGQYPAGKMLCLDRRFQHSVFGERLARFLNVDRIGDLRERRQLNPVSGQQQSKLNQFLCVVCSQDKIKHLDRRD